MTHAGVRKKARGWRRTRTISESTKVSDLTSVPSRSTQSGRSACTATDGSLPLGSAISSTSPVADPNLSIGYVSYGISRVTITVPDEDSSAQWLNLSGVEVQLGSFLTLGRTFRTRLPSYRCVLASPKRTSRNQG